MTRDEAEKILTEWTETPGLLNHARSVELVMRALARRYGEDEELFGVAGLLHDADYERFPDEHPRRIVARLEELGEHRLAHAISAHYTKWGVPHETLLDKCLIACDELTGFVSACSLVHPEGISGLKPKSVKKKLKQKSFAAKVERDEIHQGVAILGIELDELIELIIETLRENRHELSLPG
jgi:predicted hydrolase (HD superfamily)